MVGDSVRGRRLTADMFRWRNVSSSIASRQIGHPETEKQKDSSFSFAKPQLSMGGINKIVEDTWKKKMHLGSKQTIYLPLTPPRKQKPNKTSDWGFRNLESRHRH